MRWRPFYAAEVTRLGLKVALQDSASGAGPDETFRARFKREAEAVASLTIIPGIVAGV